MANIFDIFTRTSNQAIGDIDLAPAMIYLFDIVNANALPFLSTQFDVDGFKGWSLTTTEKQKRELLKTAMQIKRHLGTPYAIKQALKSVGYDQVTIKEGTAITIGSDPFSFNVTIKTNSPELIPAETKAFTENLVLYYKNARSFLVEIIYQDDAAIYLDGSWILDGSVNLQ